MDNINFSLGFNVNTGIYFNEIRIMNESIKTRVIAIASREYYERLEKARLKLRAKKKQSDQDYAPVTLKNRKFILNNICKEYNLNFDFMCKMLRVNECNADIIRFM